jgi:ribosomal-protein-alanine N-acetyltransferase
MNLDFRRMNFEDISAVHKLECKLFPDPWSQKNFFVEVSAKNLSFPFIVEENNKIIGYIICWYYINDLHIGNIAVASDQQGKGIGKYILERIFDFFVDYEKAYLEVRETNRVAIHLYEIFGFKIEYRRKSYYLNGEDALVMVKNRSQNHIRINDGLV